MIYLYSRGQTKCAAKVLILAVGGELDTVFVLPGIFTDDHLAPLASADGWQVGAVIGYEPEGGELTVHRIKTAAVNASESITSTAPVVQVQASVPQG